jgi:hypothetical protein
MDGLNTKSEARISLFEWLKELAWIIVIAVFTVAVWLADQYYEARVTDLERIEHNQKLLSQSKFKEM